MKLVKIYQCLCDETRLRILHLLLNGPLCVCHIQKIISASQVNVSRHLAYLKKHKMVDSAKHKNWKIFRLADKRAVELDIHLKCLQDCASSDSLFKKDAAQLKKTLLLQDVLKVLGRGCCPPFTSKKVPSRKQITH